jgi:uncharacterized protein (TIGR02996 family)
VNLLATVLANPTDAVALEVYADYLQEQGDSRAEDENRVRAEAQAIRDGTAPPTFDQLRAIGPTLDWKGRREWGARQEEMLKRIIFAALPDRVRWAPTQKELRLEVDGELVHVNVYWRSSSTDRVTCRISAFRTESRLLIRGKRGWNVKTFLAEAIKQVGTGLTRREADTARKARDKRLGDAIGKLLGRFRLTSGPLAPALNGEKLLLKLERSPEQMEQVLRILADNGLLLPEERNAVTAASPA